MLFNDLINLRHQPDGFRQGDDDAVVVVDVVGGEGAALAVLEPLIADLVAADVEVPDVFRDAAKAVLLRFVEPNGVIGPTDFLDHGRGGAGVGGEVLIEFGGFH